ncbi:MAG: hypothetical protein BWZ10_01823 [candidate division BRC1 bacterium ADurb.BinA364]|nr:MAG: hypothetical protein BWZ10_01823 [candidate division BRC1 bacterium ADurb.BinA364]
MHQYNTAGQQRGLSGPDETRRAVTEIALASEMTARRYGRLACYTIIPGYDDTKNRTPGLCIPRQDGLTYELAWRAGIGRDLDWALITSFNEWHEGSEIEPSVEQGDAYLKATAEWAAKFKDTKAVAEQLAAGPGWQEIQARWPKGKTIAVIGPPKGLGLDLAISGLPVRFCGLAEFGRGAVSASECPIAVYTDGELFQNDCGDGRTVEGALRDYWKDGGWIVFASWRPWPLYKNLDTDENNWSRHIGLLLTNADQGEGRRGFSVPPEESLTIRASEGEWEAPYPASGDLRFRPSFAPADGGDCLYRSFAAVIGASGSNYGDAFSAYRYESGPLAPARMVYAFQGLWTALEPEKASLLVMRQAMDLAFDKEK